MYLIVTRSFPPELGGMQNLMWGLSREPLFRSKELEELNCLENIEKHN